MVDLQERTDAEVTARAGPDPGRERRLRQVRSQGPWIGLAVVVGLLVLLPIVPLQWQAFADGAAGLRRLSDLPDLGRVLWNTVFLGLGAVVVAMALGTSLALACYALPPRWQRWLGLAPVLPIVVPSVAHVVGFVFLFSPENGYVNTALRATPLFASVQTGPINVYTPFWIVVYTGIHLAAFSYLFVFSGLRNLGADYGLAARANGASAFRVLRTVTLPMLRPVFVYSTVVVLLLALGQFTGPLMLGRREGLDVITTRMYSLTQEYPVDYAVAAAFGTPLILLALILITAQRRVLGNQNRFVGRGDASAEQAPTRSVVTATAALYVIFFVTVAAVLPLLALIFVGLSSFWSGTLSASNLTTDNWAAVLSDRSIVESIVSSLTVTGFAILIVLPLGMLIALALYNREKMWRPIAAVLDIASGLPLAIPGALVGFGFLFLFAQPWIGLYGNRAGLVIAYVAIMIPYSVRYQLATLIALGRQTVEASQVSGAGPMRTLGLIVLPLARSGITSSGAIMFVLLIHEFGVSVLLRSPDATMMSVELFDRFGSGSYPEVAVFALIMTAITAVGVAAALIFGGRRALERL